mmetsp:Transcript_26886/g.86368  ORF Transcript_26886/g.86368 Transcript_26886/m.86368 type:complete len:250 (-) Transcript_26886:100-849(-)
MAKAPARLAARVASPTRSTPCARASASRSTRPRRPGAGPRRWGRRPPRRPRLSRRCSRGQGARPLRSKTKSFSSSSRTATRRCRPPGPSHRHRRPVRRRRRRHAVARRRPRRASRTSRHPQRLRSRRGRRKPQARPAVSRLRRRPPLTKCRWRPSTASSATAPNLPARPTARAWPWPACHPVRPIGGRATAPSIMSSRILCIARHVRFPGWAPSLFAFSLPFSFTLLSLSPFTVSVYQVVYCVVWLSCG